MVLSAGNTAARGRSTAPARLAIGFQSEGSVCASAPRCSASNAAVDRHSMRSAIARSSFCRRVGRSAEFPFLQRQAPEILTQVIHTQYPSVLNRSQQCIFQQAQKSRHCCAFHYTSCGCRGIITAVKTALCLLIVLNAVERGYWAHNRIGRNTCGWCKGRTSWPPTAV